MFGRKRWDIDRVDTSWSSGFGSFGGGGYGFEPKHALIILGVMAFLGLIVWVVIDNWGVDKGRQCQMHDTYAFSGNENHDPSVRQKMREYYTECDENGYCSSHTRIYYEIVYDSPNQEDVDFFCDNGHMKDSQ